MEITKIMAMREYTRPQTILVKRLIPCFITDLYFKYCAYVNSQPTDDVGFMTQLTWLWLQVTCYLCHSQLGFSISQWIIHIRSCYSDACLMFNAVLYKEPPSSYHIEPVRNLHFCLRDLFSSCQLLTFSFGAASLTVLKYYTCLKKAPEASPFS